MPKTQMIDELLENRAQKNFTMQLKVQWGSPF